jgi:hypothetical protein
MEQQPATTTAEALGVDPALVAAARDTALALRGKAVLATRVSFVISEARSEGQPLVWVNPAFTETTGYTYDEAVGRNCRSCRVRTPTRRPWPRSAPTWTRVGR